MKTETIHGAVSVTLDDGRRCWFPPAYFNPSITGGWIVNKPYWTNLTPGHAGPDLTESEIASISIKHP